MGADDGPEVSEDEVGNAAVLADDIEQQFVLLAFLVELAGGMRTPSVNTSGATISPLWPPTSARCATVPMNATSLPRWKTGVMTM